MEVSPTILVLFLGALGSLAQDNLQGKAFVFPVESDTAHVLLKLMPHQPLTSFTVCLRHYTDLTRAHSLFSYVTKERDNELLLYKPNRGQYILFVGAASATFHVPAQETWKPGGEHVCASWESATGIATLWLNGKPLPRKGLKRGYSIPPEASIVLGQEQDAFEGDFDASQSFIGEIGAVYMWNWVLTAEDVSQVENDHAVSNPLINWRSLIYATEGYVVLQPSLFPPRLSRRF